MVKSLKLYQPRREMVARPRENRASRHDRGYDYAWSKAAARHLRRHPTCQECERAGIVAPAAVVDHKLPVRHRPDMRMEPKNRWSLCHFCHQGMKRRMEVYAERFGLIDSLMLWCDDPASRPPDLAMAPRKRKKKEEMIV